MNVLVSPASKHGSTAEIAQSIAVSLRQRGLEVMVLDPEHARGTDCFGAVILGSGVYAGHWMKAARALAASLSHRRTEQSVWLFSSGPLGDTPKPAEDPVDISDILASIRAVEHRIFAGRIDTSVLGFGERAIVAALRVPVGDTRDWSEMNAWAGGIADTLLGASPVGSVAHVGGG